MTIYFSDAAASAQAAAVGALCNTGSIKVYAATRPTDANTAVGAQTLLGTFAFAATAFGTPTGSGSTPSRVMQMAAGAISDVTAVGSGTATWFRALKSDGTTVVCDGDVSTSGSDLNLTDTSITSGETMSIASLSMAAPE